MGERCIDLALRIARKGRYRNENSHGGYGGDHSPYASTPRRKMPHLRCRYEKHGSRKQGHANGYRVEGIELQKGAAMSFERAEVGKALSIMPASCVAISLTAEP